MSPGPSRLCTVSSVKETDGRCLIGDVAAGIVVERTLYGWEKLALISRYGGDGGDGDDDVENED